LSATSGIELRAAATKAAEPPETAAAPLAAEAFVDVVRDDVELAGGVAVETVVAGARPVAVAVDQRHFDRQEFQRAVDVEQRRQRRFELVGRRLIQDLTELRQRLPRLGIVLGLDFVERLVLRRILAEVLETSAPARTPGAFQRAPIVVLNSSRSISPLNCCALR
jgi:hypothetical protein